MKPSSILFALGAAHLAMCAPAQIPRPDGGASKSPRTTGSTQVQQAKTPSKTYQEDPASSPKPRKPRQRRPKINIMISLPDSVDDEHDAAALADVGYLPSSTQHSTPYPEGTSPGESNSRLAVYLIIAFFVGVTFMGYTDRELLEHMKKMEKEAFDREERMEKAASDRDKAGRFDSDESQPFESNATANQPLILGREKGHL